MSDITTELIKITSSKDMMSSPRILQWTVEVIPVGTDVYDVVITVVDPWTYGTLSSNCFTFQHFPTGSNYAYMIAKTLRQHIQTSTSRGVMIILIIESRLNMKNVGKKRIILTKNYLKRNHGKQRRTKL